MTNTKTAAPATKGAPQIDLSAELYAALHATAEDCSHIAGWMRDEKSTPAEKLEKIAYWLERGREQRKRALECARAQGIDGKGGK